MANPPFSSLTAHRAFFEAVCSPKRLQRNPTGVARSISTNHVRCVPLRHWVAAFALVGHCVPSPFFWSRCLSNSSRLLVAGLLGCRLFVRFHCEIYCQFPFPTSVKCLSALGARVIPDPITGAPACVLAFLWGPPPVHVAPPRGKKTYPCWCCSKKIPGPHRLLACGLQRHTAPLVVFFFEQKPSRLVSFSGRPLISVAPIH